jgi:uncharacterized protein (DUF1330 family)
MSAYVIVDIEVTDAARYGDYKLLVPPTIAAYAGRYLARGGKAEVLEGTREPHRVVVLEFPTAEKAKEWLNSPEYSPLKVIRHRSAKTNMILVDGV